MRQTIHELVETIRAGRAVAYTALVETRGSTPQKAGAAMLVFPDGSQVGTLGGGCVEAEVKRRALQLLDHGETDLLTFQLDNDYGWDDGLICGGRMKMLVDPIRPGQDASYFHTLHDRLAVGASCTEAIVLDPEKAGGGHTADRFLLDDEGNVIASRVSGQKAEGGRRKAEGGQADLSYPRPSTLDPRPLTLPEQLRTNLRPLAERPRPYVTAGLSYLPFLERCRLVIVGGGHVGQRVGQLAAEVDFDVWVIDDREEYCNPERFPKAKRLIVGSIDSALSGLEIDANTYCIIVTRGHNHDEEALSHLAETPARYVGMIGSKRKIKLIFEDLLRDGLSREALARVHAPLGFDIGSQTVPEIAVSIVAELIAHRNLGAIPERPRTAGVLDESNAEGGTRNAK